MPFTPITLWNPGDPALADLQHANNIRGLLELIQALQTTAGVVGIHSVSSAPMGGGQIGVSFELTDGRVFGPFRLPQAAMNWIAAGRIVGEQYFVGDAIAFQGSSYYVLHDHVASASLNDDIVSGHIRPLAIKGADGKNSINFRSEYNPTFAYSAFDMVYVGVGPAAVYYTTFQDVPAGGTAPTAGFPWVVNYYTAIPAANVRVTAEANKLLSTVVAELRTEIADLKTRVSDLEPA